MNTDSPSFRMHIYQRYFSLRRRLHYWHCFNAPVPLSILRYHSVGEPSKVSRYINPGLSISPKRFREQIQFLRRRFRILALDELPEFLSGHQPSLLPSVVITFDDGYRDNLEVALPILAEQGAKASFFVTTEPLKTNRGLWFSELRRLVNQLPPGPLKLPLPVTVTVSDSEEGRRIANRQLTVCLSSIPRTQREEILDEMAESLRIPRGEGLEDSFLTPSQVQELRKAGMTVGAHTRSHPHLNRLKPCHHMEEIRGSRKDLETILNEPIRHFTYPNPGGGGPVLSIVRKSVEAAGFQTAGTSRAKPIGFDIDRLCLPRIGVYPGDAEELLFELLERYPKG